MLLRRLCRLGLIALSGLTTAAACESINSNAEALRFGVSPWAASAISDYWGKRVGAHLQKQLCQPVRFLSDSNYRDYTHSALAYRYDVFEAPPHIALFLHFEHHFVILLRDKFRSAKVVYFTRADTPLAALDELNGQTLATPDELGLVSLMAHARWRDAVMPPRFLKLEKHDRVIEAVLKKHVRAGVVFSPMLDSFRERRDSPIHIIAEETIPAEGFVLAAPTLSPAQQDNIQRALLQFKTSDSAIVQEYQLFTEQEIRERQLLLQPIIAAFVAQFYGLQSAPQ